MLTDHCCVAVGHIGLLNFPTAVNGLYQVGFPDVDSVAGILANRGTNGEFPAGCGVSRISGSIGE